MNKVSTYLRGRNGELSLLNIVDIMSYLTEDDYETLLVTDENKYRLDLITEKSIGNYKYYFFVCWLNNIESLDDIRSGVTLKIPKISFIKKYKSEIELIRGK